MTTKPSKVQQPHLNERCPTCGLGQFRVPDNGQQWHLTCSECDTIMFCYEPMPHQEAFHASSSKYRMYAGGYGSAKTSTCCAEIIDHILNTPNGTTLIGAATQPQLEQTAQKTFFEMFPAEYIEHHYKQKNYIITINGHTVIFRPLDDPEKARSLNLTAFWIEEASVVGYEYFEQLQTRLRNEATDFHMGILSTNPDMGWIKTEFLLKTDPEKIHDPQRDYAKVINLEDINDLYEVFIASTKLNTHLPPNYYEDTAKGKPEWWIRRFLDGSFENKEGLVYPQALDHIVEPFDIPDHWEKFQASDFGLNDPTVGLWGAIDPRSGCVYVYDEHYENRQNVKYHAEAFRKRLDPIPHGLLRFVVGDPKGQAKSERDMKSLFDHYAEYGVYFQPGINKIEDGISKVYTFFDLGILKIFKTCKNTIEELKNYRYPEPKITDKKNVGDKPIDKDNHAMDSLKYMIAELPDDVTELINPHYASYMPKERKQAQDAWALSDDSYENDMNWESYY